MQKINLFLLDGFDEIFFEEVNEYTVVIAALAVRRGLQVTFQDRQIELFPWAGGKIICSEDPITENVLYVQSAFYPIYTPRDRFCTTDLFHSLFMLQWMTDLPREKIRYLSLAIRKTEGIGSILAVFSQAGRIWQPLGIRVYIEPGSTRFSDKLLSKYFAIGTVPEDASEENTAYVKCFNCFVLNHLTNRYPAQIRLDMLQPSFVTEMKIYADQLISGRKVLGVLLRGTDYVVANFAGNYRPAPIEDCIQIIKDRIRRYGYERIFLATEDAVFLEKMTAAFPHKVITVSQERHTVSEVREVKYLSELEKKENTGRAYEASVEDTTINYFS